MLEIYEDLKSAILLIKSYCVSHDCNECFLRTHDNGCEITENSPNIWEIKNAETIPRIFK